MPIENIKKLINDMLTCTLEQVIIDLELLILHGKNPENNIPGLKKAITILDAYIEKHNYM